MKECKIKVDKRIKDKRIIVLNDININKNTKYKYLDKLLLEVNDLEPNQIIIPGNLYSFNKEDLVDSYMINYFLTKLNDIADTYYIKGNNEINNKANILSNDNIHLLCERNNYLTYCKNFYVDDINILGMKLNNYYYKANEDEKIKILLTKYKNYLEKLKLFMRNGYLNILVCYDSLITKLYDQIEDLSLFDIVITSNNYNNKEQLIQNNNTLFFLSDSINSNYNSIKKIFQSSYNIDILNIEYNTKGLIKKYLNNKTI